MIKAKKISNTVLLFKLLLQNIYIGGGCNLEFG